MSVSMKLGGDRVHGHPSVAVLVCDVGDQAHQAGLRARVGRRRHRAPFLPAEDPTATTRPYLVPPSSERIEAAPSCEGSAATLLMFGVLGLAAVALVACGEDDDDDVGEANAAFCDDLAAYGTAVADLAALDPATATKSDYDSAADDVRTTART